MEPAYKWIVDAKVCGTCAHYRQHYTLQPSGVFRPLWYGHCHVPRWGKHPRPDETCPHWTDQERDPVPPVQT